MHKRAQDVPRWGLWLSFREEWYHLCHQDDYMALLILPPSLHIDVVIFENQKLHMQTGYSILSPPRLANPSPKPLVVFGFSHFFRRVKSVNSHKDGEGRDRHPRNCDRFWLLMSLGRVKSINSHRDGAGWGRHPRNCDRFWLLILFWRVQKSQQSQGWGGSGSPSSKL